jgi:hypothetical protein
VPISADPRFVRQRVVDTFHAGIVIPRDAHIKPEVAREFQRLNIELGPPTDPPAKFAFHYLDAPVEKSLLEDGTTIDSGTYEFNVRDAVISVFDLPSFQDDEFSWSFSSSSWTDVLAAVKIGETLDVVFDNPFEKVYHVSKHHFPSRANSGYGSYPIHITVDSIRPHFFRVVTAFEPQSSRTESRLPFFFGFRVCGRRATDLRPPVWKELLGDAVRQAQQRRWDHALLYTAFALEAFIDERLAGGLEKSGLGDTYVEHVLQVGSRRNELHGLNSMAGGRRSKNAINTLSERLNTDVFSPRNRLAHGRKLETVTAEQVVKAMKTTVEFIWDWDRSARNLLVPLLPVGSFQSMVDEQLLYDCQTE